MIKAVFKQSWHKFIHPGFKDATSVYEAGGFSGLALNTIICDV